MAVVVQRQLEPAVPGVLFTAHPVSGSRRHMVIEAVAGLGDAPVSGQAVPDHCGVDAATGSPLMRLFLAGAKPLRSPKQIAGLVAHFGAPQDIEWAIASDRFWLLQARLVTALPTA